MRFSVLGTVRVEDEGAELPLQGAKQRALLAVLLARPGAATPAEKLIEALWASPPPSSVSQMVRWHVHKLRRTLGAEDRVVRVDCGYRLVTAPGEVDAERFQSLYAKARVFFEAGDPRRCADALEAAERLWRGPAYGDLDLKVLREKAASLEALRLSAMELRAEADLALARTEYAIALLQRLVTGHPLREGPRALLMRALYLAGRQAEALQVYQEGRRLLADELGIDPGPELRRTEVLILSQAPELRSGVQVSPTALHSTAGPPGRRVPPAAAVPSCPFAAPPSELPRDLASLIGRAAETTALVSALADGGIGAICGPPGVGKTALAVHVAHRLADTYPDGQCYVRLDTGTRPGQLLGRLLWALGVPAERLGTEERAAAFRTATAERRILLVLDGADHAASVASLIPAGPAAVLTTSWSPPTVLTVDHRIQLAPLGLDDSVALLARAVPDGRILADPAVAANLAGLCGGLPLALSVLAARMLARPHWSAAEFARRLSDPQRRLHELDDGERSVRSALLAACRAVSRRQGPGSLARLWQMFSMVGASGLVDVRQAAGSAGLTDRGAEILLEALADVHLIESEEPGRYRAEGLFRLFARECSMIIGSADH
ncbi:transcriptional regulator [Streptomyces sp. NPDC051183]|uniref:AfsR/SARP family transcriptional regulator n=1 Tax=Streptomyces sp. NPDC051183 TaxID=3155165 RepID=UPI00342E2C6D